MLPYIFASFISYGILSNHMPNLSNEWSFMKKDSWVRVERACLYGHYGPKNVAAAEPFYNHTTHTFVSDGGFLVKQVP